MRLKRCRGRGGMRAIRTYEKNRINAYTEIKN
jgi:hypothetical protein